MPAPPPPARNRVEYIDGLRGVCVVAMFYAHTTTAWLATELRDGTYWARAMAIAGVVAPTFLFLAGLSIAIVADRERAAGVDPRTSQQRIFKRGLEILATGYALHFAFFALAGFEGKWLRIFKVDVLHCIGLSMMVFSKVAWPSGKTNVRAGLAFLALPLLSSVAYRLPIEHWLPPGLASYFTTRGSLALFPFFPYAGWVALGLFVAPWWLAASKDPRKELRFGVALLAAAASFYLASKAAGRLYYRFDLDSLGIDLATDPPQVKGLLHLFWMKAAYVFLAFSLALFTRTLWRARAAKPLLLFGKRSLFAYCAHLIIIYPLIGRFFSHRLLPAQQMAMTAALTVAMYGLTLLWVRFDVAAVARRRAPVPKELGLPDPDGGTGA